MSIAYTNNSPLVTVGVASYNNSKFILETLDSIANQTYKNIEILINDDASTDNSVELIENWILLNPKFKTVFSKSEKNEGICKAGNRLLKAATGKYICLIGSDDKYLPEFIEKRVKLLEETDEKTGFCYSLTYLIDTHGVRTGVESRPTPSGYIFEKITMGNNSLCKPFTCMVKADCYKKIGYYDERLMYEDLDWFLRASKEFKIEYFNSFDSEYRTVPGSLGTQLLSKKGVNSNLIIIKKHLGYSKQTDQHFRMRLWKLFVKSYKNKLPVAREILEVSIVHFKGLKELLFYFVSFIPVSWSLKSKKFIKSIFSVS